MFFQNIFPCSAESFSTLRRKSSHASPKKIILVDNKKYIAAIFNILVDNKKYDAENKHFYFGVRKYSPQCYLVQGESHAQIAFFKCAGVEELRFAVNEFDQQIVGIEGDNATHA